MPLGKRLERFLHMQHAEYARSIHLSMAILTLLVLILSSTLVAQPVAQPAAQAPAQTQAPTNETRDLRVEALPGVSALPSSDRRWALLVGVDQYQDKQIRPLTGAAADAHALGDALVKYAGFDPQHVIVLATDLPPERQPTRGNILLRLSNISSLVPKDGLLLFSFAGHGIERNGQAFLLSEDAKVSNDIRVLQETTIGAGSIKQWIREMGIKQVLMLMDACRNDPMAGLSDTPNRMAESYRKAFTFDVQNHDVEAFATLYATRVGERAYLNVEKGHGYFIWALLEGLKGAAANSAGEVTLGSLQRYVQDIVPKTVKVDLGSGVDQRPFAEVGGYRAEELVLSRATPKSGPGDVAVANARAKELEQWEGISHSRDLKLFAAFREKFAGSSLAVEATRRMEQLTWETVKNTNDPKALQDFLGNFPGGVYAPQATAAVETLRQVVADRQAIVVKVSRYAEVFSRKDLDQIKVLWPTLNSRDARKFQDFFNMARSIRLSYQAGTPEINGDKASVECERTIQFTDELGPQPPVQNRVTFRLRRTAETWAIESLQ